MPFVRVLLGGLAVLLAASRHGVAAPDEPFRLALLRRQGGHGGAGLLRSGMLASAINQRSAQVERELGFKFIVQDMSLGAIWGLTGAQLDAAWPNGVYPHAVVAVKTLFPASVMALLAERCIMPVTDVMDMTSISDNLIKARGMLAPPLMRTPNVTLPRPLFIVQTRATISHVEMSRPAPAELRANPQLARAVVPLLAVVPHQETNVGNWRVRTPEEAMRPIRRIGILAGDKQNLPDENVTLQLAAVACNALTNLVLINENTFGGRLTQVSVYNCDSSRKVILPPRTTRGGKDPAPPRTSVKRYNGSLADSVRYNFSSQAWFHDVPWVQTIDLALLWPAPRLFRGNQIEARPVTRMLFWWSHGVPTIFYPFAAYTEAALESGYALPARAWQKRPKGSKLPGGARGVEPWGGVAPPGRPPGAGAQAARTVGRAAAEVQTADKSGQPPMRLPVAASAFEFSRVLRQLLADPPARRTLAEIGLRAVAERYSPVAIGARLIRTVRGAVRTLRAEGGTCTPRLPGQVFPRERGADAAAIRSQKERRREQLAARRAVPQPGGGAAGGAAAVKNVRP